MQFGGSNSGKHVPHNIQRIRLVGCSGVGKQLISGKKWSPFGLAEGLMKLEIGCRLDQLVSRKGKCGCPLASH